MAVPLGNTQGIAATHAKAPRRPGLTQLGSFGLVLAMASGCGGATSAEEAPATAVEEEAVELAEPPAPATVDPHEGEQAPPAEHVSYIDVSWNDSPDGAVTTTLGDYVVDVHSHTPVTHTFREAAPGVAEQMFLAHWLQTEDGRRLRFEFAYTEGVLTGPVLDAGQGRLSILQRGEELVAVEGTVTIAPVGTEAIRVSFEDVSVAPVTVDSEGLRIGEPLEFVGSGAVEGPLYRLCERAEGVVHADDGQPLPPTPPPVHDDAWIRAFCSSPAASPARAISRTATPAAFGR